LEYNCKAIFETACIFVLPVREISNIIRREIFTVKLPTQDMAGAYYLNGQSPNILGTDSGLR
jgi:hypothetical protein